MWPHERITFRHDAAAEENYDECVYRIRGEKPSFEKWGKSTLLLIGQFPCWLFKGKLLAGSVVREKNSSHSWDKDCLFEGL